MTEVYRSSLSTSRASESAAGGRLAMPIHCQHNHDGSMVRLLLVWFFIVFDGAASFGVVGPVGIRSSFLGAQTGLYAPVPPRGGPQAGSSTRLSMMFDQLSKALSDIAKNFGPKQRMTENAIQPALKEVRRALLDADVNIQVADALIDGVKTRSLGQELIEGVTADQQFVKAMYDELLDMMGGDSSATDARRQLSVSSSAPAATLATGTPDDPAVVLLAGLQGAGKTTAAGKLALFLKEREVDDEAVAKLGRAAQQLPSFRLPKRHRRVLLVAADVYRPAAIEQLQVLGNRIGVPVFAAPGTDADPVQIVQDAIQYAKHNDIDTIIVDTAGRQVVDTDLMNELQRLQKVAQPRETLLIVDAMTGQAAAALTAAFDHVVGLTGAILTKLDGDARGGAAVSVRGVSGRPIKFVGTGEQLPDLEPFYPDRMASRILGMGDVVSLVEKAAAQVSEVEAEKMSQKIRDATFDFDDFLQQSELVSKMGNVAAIAKMMPGIGNQLSGSRIKEVEERLKVNKSMINSMTTRERQQPDLLIKNTTSRSRLIRITKGSGRTYEQGIQFVGEFQRMRTMMSRMQKQMGGGGMAGDPKYAEEDEQMTAPQLGNRAMRRAAKKQKIKGRGGGGGFG